MTAAMLRRADLALLAVLLASSAASGDERSIARRFEAARRDEPSLTAFLRQMPKGGDLHHHFPAGHFAEEAVRSANRAQAVRRPGHSRFEAETATGRVPAARLLTDDALRYQFLNAASMRGPITCPAGGHDHFFQTLGVLGTAIPNPDLAQGLVEIVRRARLQKIQYLE